MLLHKRKEIKFRGTNNFPPKKGKKKKLRERLLFSYRCSFVGFHTNYLHNYLQAAYIMALFSYIFVFYFLKEAKFRRL